MTVSIENVKELEYSDETVFGEIVNTFSTRMNVLDVRPTFSSDRQSDMSLQNTLYASRPGYLMPRSGGTLELDVYFSGALVDTASGALAHTSQTKLLADGLGGSDLTQVGGVAGATATTTSMPSITGLGVRGGIKRVGIKGDTRGDGQAVVLGNPVTSTLTAMPTAPGAADATRAGIMLYPTETPGATKRFMVGWNSTQNAGAQYVFRGCQLQNVVLAVSIGALPKLTLRYIFAYWEQLSGFTVPTGTAIADCKPAISAAGSYFLQTVATTTRVLENAADLTLALNLDLAMIMGQGGNYALQTIVGYARKKTAQLAGTLTFSPQWNGVKPSEYDADGSDSVKKHFLATFSAGSGTAATEGRHVGFYCPSMFPIGQRPNVKNTNELLYQDVMYGLGEGLDTTNDLTRSFIRFYVS